VLLLDGTADDAQPSSVTPLRASMASDSERMGVRLAALGGPEQSYLARTMSVPSQGRISGSSGRRSRDLPS
jgi:hypothetical protein